MQQKMQMMGMAPLRFDATQTQIAIAADSCCYVKPPPAAVASGHVKLAS
jgi:hypothetical protein